MIDYVATGVRSHLTGKTSDLLLAEQVNEVDIILSTYPNIGTIYN